MWFMDGPKLQFTLLRILLNETIQIRTILTQICNTTTKVDEWIKYAVLDWKKYIFGFMNSAEWEIK